MKTKYNNEMELNEFCDKLVGRIYKILPLIEEDKENAKKYLNSLIVELDGANEHFENKSNFQSILFSLEGIKNITDYNVCRKRFLNVLIM